MTISFPIFTRKIKKFKIRDRIIKRILLILKIYEFNFEAIILCDNYFSFFGFSRYLSSFLKYNGPPFLKMLEIF